MTILGCFGGTTILGNTHIKPRSICRWTFREKHLFCVVRQHRVGHPEIIIVTTVDRESSFSPVDLLRFPRAARKKQQETVGRWGRMKFCGYSVLIDAYMHTYCMGCLIEESCSNKFLPGDSSRDQTLSPKPWVSSRNSLS